MKEFSQWLSEELGKQGISQRELVKRTGCTEASISKYKNGKYDPSLTSLRKIADALGYRVELVKKKEQEEDAVEPELEGGGHFWWYVCGECHGIVADGVEHCMWCRRRLIWK